MDRLSLLAVFAHPDDETFGTGGTLAKYVAEGVSVALVCATRGEAGEIYAPSLATRDTLAQVRENELRCALDILGVPTLRFLDYVDGQLSSADFQEAEGRVVRAIRELRPDVIFTFGPDGVYGHPDHIAISRLTTAAFDSAADPTRFPDHLAQGLKPHQAKKLYYRAVSRQQFRKMLRDAASAGADISLGEIDLDNFGVDESVITTRIDTDAYLGVKLRAIECHATQIQPNSPWRKATAQQLRDFMRYETYTLARSLVSVPAGIEDDLFAGIR